MKTRLVFLMMMVLLNGRALSQNIFPTFGNAGIGTQLSIAPGPVTSLHIHYDPPHSDKAILQLSEGRYANTDTFAILGLMPGATPTYSSLGSGLDLILHEHRDGDIILTNYWAAGSLTHKTGGSIRLATAGDTSLIHRLADTTVFKPDYERVTILCTGNVGINVPPDTTGLALPTDQLTIGGGTWPRDGFPDPIPGLTMYGGSRFEGKQYLVSTLPIRYDSVSTDWRYLGFNYYLDHLGPASGTHHRPARMPSANVQFAPNAGGLLQLNVYPYDSASSYTTSRGLTSFDRGVDLCLTGNNGLEMWSDEGPSDNAHHLLDIWRPGHYYHQYSSNSDSIRNEHGLCIHYTPVLITTGKQEDVPNFTELANVHPNYGDGKTWMLAVNGPALFKEAFVSPDWADFVFEDSYTLPSLHDVEAYTKAHHHLPGIPSADSVAKHGVALGETEAKLLQKIEELTLYTIQLQKQMEAMKQELDELKKGGK